MNRVLAPTLAALLLAAACSDERQPIASETSPGESRGGGAFGGGIPGSIVFGSDRDDPEGESGEIYTMNADGSGATRLTFEINAMDAWPSWSPNGRHITFTSDRTGDREVWAMDADGGNQVNLTNSPGVDAASVYSPNGRQIAFHSNRNGNFEIYRMDANGSNQTRLTDDPSQDVWPDWSPDGKEIAFSRNFDIAILNIASGTVRIPAGHPARDDMPVFSPNGKQIVFMSARDGYPSIFVMDVDGSNPRNLTPRAVGFTGTWFSFFPSWSKNGQQIYFSSHRPGTSDVDVFVMNADGTEVRQLTNAPGWDFAPAAR